MVRNDTITSVRILGSIMIHKVDWDCKCNLLASLKKEEDQQHSMLSIKIYPPKQLPD